MSAINLEVPGGEVLEVGVERLNGERYRCVASTEFLMTDYRMLMGDEFDAMEDAGGPHRLISVVSPGDMLHYRFDLGLFVFSPSLAGNREAIAEARDEIGDYIENGIVSASMKRYLETRTGGCDIDEFLQHVSVLIHVPRTCQNEFLRILPEMSPELARAGYTEIQSGQTEW